MSHRVCVLALDGVVAFDLATPPQVFASASCGYSVSVCGRGRVRAAQGFDVVPDAALSALGEADTVVVPGVGDVSAPVPRSVLAALQAASARGARMTSICTGAFVLGQAGLLEGRRVTTHWAYVDELRRQFRSVTVEPDVLWVDDGDLVTSAGVAAGIDLCLHLVRRDFGAEAANRAARRMVVAPHRSGGQAQFVERPVPDSVSGSLAGTREWALTRLDSALTVADLAAHAGYSPRSFARKFREETATTPLQWLLAQRVDLARRLLERSDLPVEEVAVRAGFGGAVSLRDHFRRVTSTTPTGYRAAFRGGVDGGR